MATATLRMPVSLPETRKASGKSWFVRLYWAIAEARMHAAMREIRMHRHLMPEDMVEKAGYRASIANDGAYPFTK